MCNTSRYRYCYLPQDVLWDGLAFLDNLLVEFIQRCIHQLHTDPNVPLRGKTKKCGKYSKALRARHLNTASQVQGDVS